MYGEHLLAQNGISDAETDARLLLFFAAEIDGNAYYMQMQKELPQEKKTAYDAMLRRRANRIPLQHITGEQEFMGLRFLVSEHALIPRQDTEILVEEALKRVKPGMRVLDMCTGSGCIITSIVKYAPSVCGVAADLSPHALSLARENARLNGVTVEFVQSDLFAEISGSFDMIVSNPPYIPTGEIAGLAPEVREREPRLALDGRADGLWFYRRILSEGAPYLKPGGDLLFEIGADQKEAVFALMRDAGCHMINGIKDLAGLDRVVTGKGRNYV